MNFKIGQKWGKYTITGIKTIIHGKYFTNTQLTHQIALLGTRGTNATAYIHKSGTVGKLMRNFDYFEGEQTLDARG